MKNLLMLLPLLFLFISGCGANDNNDNIENDYGKIYFRPHHLVNADIAESKNGLYLYTQQIYNSAAYYLDIDQYYSQGAIILKVKGVAEAGGGAEVMVPAGNILDLNAYNGTYPLIISGPNFRDEYKLTVNNQIISIEGPATIHTEPTLRSLEAGVNIRKQL